MKIYGFALSPFVRKVMLVAEEKGIETEVVPASPMQPTEEFLAASPYAKIPAIDDGGFKLADSTAIAVYLDTKYPEPALLPADPECRAKAVWFDEVGDTVIVAAGGPMLFNRVIASRIGQAGDEDAAQASENTLTGRLGYLEQALGQDGWLDGEFSLGDISIASAFRSFGYAGWKLDEAAFPKLAGWYGRVCERPAWRAVAENEDRMMAAAGF